MKRVKVIFLIFLLGYSGFTYGHKGFEIIRKAEEKFEKGESKKALKLLKKAEKKDYGFCGNAVLTASRSINLLRAKIYMNQGEYEKARNSLNLIYAEYSEDNIDSIRIRTYQMEFGKEVLGGMVGSLENTHIEEEEDGYFYVKIPLQNGIEMRLKIASKESLPYMLEENKDKRAKMWVEKFKTSDNYKLLKGKDIQKS